MKDKIWLSPPHKAVNEEKYIKNALDSNWIAPVGPQLVEFENKLELYLSGKNYFTALNSGTSAIHIALKMLNVGVEDEVLCQSFSFCATANPITYLGANPIFIDSEEDTWNMSPVFLEEAIKSRIGNYKKPKAIIFANIYGMPAKIEEILEVANKYKIPVIEDAAEALGSKYKKTKCGSFGNYSIVSFNGNKIITTSGGGAIITRDKKSKEKALYLATQAKEKAFFYEHKEVGYNYRLSNISAAIGIAQLELIKERVKQRRENHNFYSKAFKNNINIEVFDEPNENYFSNHWLTCILINSKTNITVNEALVFLNSKNIEARALWKPLHLQPVFKNNLYFGESVCENLFKKGLCLPSGSSLKDEEKTYIANQVNTLLKDNL